jgi:anaerobic ribonucleoside-triphosphate reductase
METQLNNTDLSRKNSETKLQIPCEVYSRIVGYLRPVQNWNEGKKQEFMDRRTFVVRDTDKEDQ